MSEIHEEIKERLVLADVIIDMTGFYIPAGKYHLSECPFCGKAKCFSMQAGLGANKDKAYKCHSESCGASGDVFVFIENYLNIDQGAALRKAADLAGIDMKEPSTRMVVQQTIRQRIFHEAMEYYHDKAMEPTLPGMPSPGREYFITLRKHDEKLVKSMKLGYADGKLYEHLKKSYSIEDLVSSGLVQEFNQGEGDSEVKHYRDFFAENIVIFPHFDKQGFVIHFTQKDLDKERGLPYQMKKEHRDNSWVFYNQKVLSSPSVILVEGENDALTIMKAGYHNVMACIGSISEHQMKALQDNLKHKDLFLWFDKDDAGSGLTGKSYVEKVCRALKGAAYSVYVIEHPGDTKDADEYLNGFDGDIRAEAKRLQSESINYIRWQLIQISKKKEISEIIDTLRDRKIFSTINTLPRMDRMPYIELMRQMGFSDEAIQEEMEVNKELRAEIKIMAKAAGTILKVDPMDLIPLVYQHFEANGKFFKDNEHNVYLLYGNIIYEISNNRLFNALLYKSGGLLFNRAPGAQLWEGLQNEGFNNGTIIDLASWMKTDLKRDAIYINLNAADNTILRIDKESIKEVPNGLNEDDVLLKASSKIKKMEFHPGQDIRTGLQELKRLVMDNMTCEREQRYFIICWFISAFLLDFMPYMALMKFSGASDSGKTTTAKFLSMLTYGQEVLGTISAAAAYSAASQNPMVILDNLEEKNRNKSMKDFLLLCATGGSKEKRAGGTDSDTVQEKPRSLVLITAIEPLEEPELINRTVDINFGKQHKHDRFIETEALRGLVKHRDSIMSAILMLIQRDILPNMDEGLKANLGILKKEYKGHSKSRVDEYIALLMFILEKIIPHMPFKGEDDMVAAKVSAAEIWRSWINYQNVQAEEDETMGNSILRMLDGLAAEYVQVMRELEYNKNSEQLGLKEMIDEEDEWGQMKVATHTHTRYLLTAEKTRPQAIKKDKDGNDCEPYTRSYLSITAKSSDLVNALSRWCGDNSLRNPHAQASAFTKRLLNDEATLKRAGWTIEIKDRKKGPYSKIINGTRFLTLRKELVR